MNNETELLELVRDYDEQALCEVYDLYSPGIYRYAVRLLGDSDLAEDCVSETFSRFLYALKQGHGPRQYLQAYLYRVAHNWITDYYRRQAPVTTEIDPDYYEDDAPDPEEKIETLLNSEAVRRALAELTPEQRQVIVLKYLEDWQNKEIAEAIDKPVGAVKALQHRGLNALRRVLLKETEVVI